MEEEKKGPGFVVKDRRHFDEDGETRDEKERKPAEPTGPPEAPPTAPQPEAEKPSGPVDPAGEDQQAVPPETPEEETYPPVDFLGFIMSLSTSAMFHFGDFPDPSTGTKQRNLSAAKQTVDILGILKEKTEGNLTNEEKRLLEGILFELRMRYVKEKGRQ